METINYYPSTTTIGGLLFSNYISEEIRCLSVKELTSSQAIDRLGVLISDSPYDLALGPFDKKNDRCFTYTFYEQINEHMKLNPPSSTKIESTTEKFISYSTTVY
ncbi:unnamed protein product [Rotaria sp. Silwood1]|nr:unnamed protein product [Rotaria sp. Silwood1]CAF1571905.1 unnamed protein product [Rotaria sp. Silwood1]CAF3666186.1 unnamed protein product [Rotaria sp. Silwood1]CAF3732719.1 unnamed protein product [Rotaria sp. Silwood1]